MKKTIEISRSRRGYYENKTDFVFVPGDVNAYEIVLQLPQNVDNAQFVIQAKRGDGEVVTDSVSVSGTRACYTLKNNMYSVPGDVIIRLQVAQDGGVLTDCQCVFTVEEAYESDIAGDDRVPVLTSLITQTQTAAAAAADAASRVPDAETMETIVTDAHTHANASVLDATTAAYTCLLYTSPSPRDTR